MVALPEPRPETPRQAEKRQAIENVQRNLLGRQLMADELTPAGLAARQREGIEALKGLGVGLPAGLFGLPADLLALLVRDAPSLLNKLVTGEPLDIEERGQFAKAVDAFQEVAGAEGIARAMGFGENLDAESEGSDAASRAGMNPFRQGMLTTELVADPFLAVKGIGALLKAGSRTDTPATRSTDLVSDTPQADTTDVPTRSVAGIEGGIVDFTPPDADPSRDMDIFSFGVEMVHTPTGARIPPETVIRGRFSEFETVERRDARLVNRTEFTQRMATPEETAAFQRGEDPAAQSVRPTEVDRGDFADVMMQLEDEEADDLMAALVSNDRDYAADVAGELLSRRRGDDLGAAADPVNDAVLNDVRSQLADEAEMFVERFMGLDVAELTPETPVTVFRVGDIQPGEVQSFSLSRSIEGRQLPGQRIRERRGEERQPLVEYTVRAGDILAAPNATFRGGRGTEDEVEVLIDSANVTPNQTIEGEFTATPATAPEGDEANQLFDAASQAALTPIRTEGQEQLRRQAFPVTEDMDVFEPSGITELGPNYLAGDPTLVVPGSGQRGIATTFDFARTTETQARRQGNIADYSPTFQTIDRLPEKPLGTNEPYTPEEVINILEAQPQAGMRDLKGSGFLEYLESPYAPDTYDSVEDIRKDYRNYTAQLKVNTVTNTDIAEQYARAAVDPSTVDDSVPFVYPNVRSGGSIPESGTQSFFEEGTDQAPFDRGVIIINNPNTMRTPDGDTLRAPTVGGIDHDYFGGSSGVEGYIAHSRFAVVLSPTGKKVAVVEEIQGNTVAQAARDRQLALTPLNKARLTAAQRSRDYTLSVNMSDSATQMAQGIEKTREELRELANDGKSLSSGSFRVRELLDERPRGEFYNMVFDAYQKDLKQAEGVFDIDKLTEYGSGMLIAPMIRPNMFSEDGALLVALSRNATPEQKKLLTDLFQNNDIKSVEGNTATFDDFVSSNTDMYRISSSLERKLVGGEITSGTDRVLAREMLEFLNPLGNFDDQYEVLTDDIANRILIEGDAIDSFITKLGEEAKTKRSKAGQKFVDEYGLDESLQIEEVYTQAQRTGFEGGLMPGQPFAATTHFDEYMPRLILQELIRRGDIDEVVFPSSEALLSVGGRGSLRTGPQRAGFNQTYVKGVDKGLKTIKKENPDFSVEIKENYTPGGDPTDNVTLAGKSRVINLRDPAVKAIFEGRLIRRAKGGEVDLRPRKMIHSGIGAMAKEVM